MKMMFSWLGQPQAVQLGWTLAHFIWQGSLLGAAWLWLRHALRASSPEVRYRVACGILVLMAAAPPATWAVLRSSPLVAGATSRVAAGPGEIPPTFAFMDPRSPTGATTSAGAAWVGWAGRVEATSNDLMPWLALIWLGGVAAGALRLGAGAGRVASVRQRSATVEDQRLLACVEKLRERLGVTIPVRLLKSAWVEVPTVIG